MRVLITTDAVGGVWDHSVALAQGLQEQGDEPSLAVFGPSLDEGRRSEAKGIPLHEVPGPLEWMPGGVEGGAAARRHLQRIVKEQRIDVVHANSFSHVVAGLPTVLVVHSTLHGWWQAVRGAVPPPPEWEPYRRLAAQAIQQAGVVAVPTAPMEAEVRAYAPPHRLAVVPNGLPPLPAAAAGLPMAAVLRPPPAHEADSKAWPARAASNAGDLQERGSGSGPRSLDAHRALQGAGPAVLVSAGMSAAPHILAGGRLWDEGKGHSVLDQAAARIPWPVHATGSAAGPSWTARFAHLRLRGHLSPEGLAQEIAGAALFVNPALYEPFGLGALRAALQGVPLLLSDLPTHRSVWSNAAEYVPPRDADALASAIRDLMGDVPRREAMAAAALARAARFTTRSMAAGYRRLYQEILEGPCTT